MSIAITLLEDWCPTSKPKYFTKINSEKYRKGKMKLETYAGSETDQKTGYLLVTRAFLKS